MSAAGVAGFEVLEAAVFVVSVVGDLAAYGFSEASGVADSTAAIIRADVCGIDGFIARVPTMLGLTCLTGTTVAAHAGTISVKRTGQVGASGGVGTIDAGPIAVITR